MRRSLVLVAASLVAVACSRPVAPAPKPPPGLDLLAWEYPGSRPIARADPVLAAAGKVGLEEIASAPRESGRIKPPAIYAYDTPDSIAAVYGFFAGRLGLDPEYRPATIAAEDAGMKSNRLTYPGLDAYPNFRAAYTGLEGRQAVQTATLVGPGDPGTTVVVVLSRGAREGFTSIDLVVTAGPAR